MTPADLRSPATVRTVDRVIGKLRLSIADDWYVFGMVAVVIVGSAVLL